MSTRTVDLRDVAAVLEDLPRIVSDARARRRASLRDVEVESGVPFNCTARVERGEGQCSLANAAALLRWAAS